MALGTLEEVDRPALAAVVPHLTGRTLLIDVGANANCKARNLEEFAVMGKVYTSAVFHTPNPRVGLMSMGEEETKGNELTKEVHEVLKDSTLNFIGNVEGHDLFTGKVDVIVMDGFTGNVALKASETLAESMMHLIKEELMRTPLRKFGAMLSRGAFAAVQAAHRPRRVRRRAAARRQGLLRDRPRQLQRGRGQARHPRGRRVLHQRRERAHRGRAARPGRAQGTDGLGAGEPMSVAFVFPGQGSQKVGMGKALAEAFPESRAVFDEADAALGFPLSRLCFEGPGGRPPADRQHPARDPRHQHRRLARPGRARRPARTASPATASASTRRWWRRGRSTSRDAAVAVRRRGQYMQEAVPVGEGAMAAILGLDLPAIEAACREAAQGQVVSPANINSPGQVVIAGHKAAVERASALCKAAGAKRAVPPARVRALPLRAHGAGAGAAGPGPRAASRFHDPARPAGEQRRRARRARRRTSAATGWCARSRRRYAGRRSVEALAREGVDTVRRGRAGHGALRPGQEDRQGRCAS